MNELLALVGGFLQGRQQREQRQYERQRYEEQLRRQQTLDTQGQERWQQEFGLRQTGQQADISENLARRLQSGQQFDTTMQQRSLEDTLGRMDTATANAQRMAQANTALQMGQNKESLAQVMAVLQKQQRQQELQGALGLRPPAPTGAPSQLSPPSVPQQTAMPKPLTAGLTPAPPPAPTAPAAPLPQEAFRRLFAVDPEFASRYASGMSAIDKMTPDVMNFINPFTGKPEWGSPALRDDLIRDFYKNSDEGQPLQGLPPAPPADLGLAAPRKSGYLPAPSGIPGVPPGTEIPAAPYFGYLGRKDANAARQQKDAEKKAVTAEAAAEKAAKEKREAVKRPSDVEALLKANFQTYEEWFNSHYTGKGKDAIAPQEPPKERIVEWGGQKFVLADSSEPRRVAEFKRMARMAAPKEERDRVTALRILRSRPDGAAGVAARLQQLHGDPAAVERALGPSQAPQFGGVDPSERVWAILKPVLHKRISIDSESVKADRPVLKKLTWQWYGAAADGKRTVQQIEAAVQQMASAFVGQALGRPSAVPSVKRPKKTTPTARTKPAAIPPGAGHPTDVGVLDTMLGVGVSVAAQRQREAEREAALDAAIKAARRLPGVPVTVPRRGSVGRNW